MRTIEEIKETICADFMRNESVAELFGFTPGDSFTSHFSKVSVIGILFYIFAVAAWTLEKLFDTYKGEMDTRIEEIIPHRHPFLLIDCIEEVTPGEGAVGYKNVTYNEPWFAGHFPQEPVMPGVLIIEALAQVGAVAILSLDENKGKIAFFGGINKCRFKGKVKPGDKLRLETKIIRHKGPMGVGEAVASVDGKVVAQAELTFMVGAAQ